MNFGQGKVREFHFRLREATLNMLYPNLCNNKVSYKKTMYTVFTKNDNTPVY